MHTAYESKRKQSKRKENSVGTWVREYVVNEKAHLIVRIDRCQK